MRNRPECLPCCLRRVLFAASLQSDDEWLHRKILAEAMQEAVRADDDATPAEIVYALSKRAARALGQSDPWAPDRKRWLEAALGVESALRESIEAAADRFAEALRLTLAANLLDCEFRDEIRPGFSIAALRKDAAEARLGGAVVEDLRQAVESASRILYVHESAGELLFDRLLIETFAKPVDAVVSVVRESPALGGATAEDAAAVGLARVARVIDPGIGCRGVLLASASQAFRDEYLAADLVIAKGQAAYETLEGRGGEIAGGRKPTAFLMRVKCAVLARELGAALGDAVIEWA